MPPRHTLDRIWTGLGLGLLTLAGAWWTFARFGQRLPLRPFFITSSALLCLMAFRFTGAGLQELQEGGVPLTNLPCLPRWNWLQDWFQVYPYRESLTVQGGLLLALVAALVYTFWGKGVKKLRNSV